MADKMKMGFEPNANHVHRKYGNQPVTLKFTREPKRITFRSKLEARYANYLERLRELGQILGWWYEDIRLEFPDGNPKEWTPDFVVLTDTADLEIHECKGMCSTKDVDKLIQTKRHYAYFGRLVVIFDRERNTKPRIKAAMKQWADVQYADPMFKSMFGNTKAGVL